MSMDAPRAVFVDLDDTFLAPDKSIPAANLELMDQLDACGVELVPCTGRHVGGVPEAMRAHRCVRHIVASNGGIVHDTEARRDIHQVAMPTERIVGLYERLRDLPVIFDAFADGHAYSEQARKHLFDQIDVPEGLRAYLKGGRTFTDMSIPELLPTVGPVTKLSLFFVDEEGARAIDEGIAAAGCLYYVQTSASNYEAMHVDATKGAALTWLAHEMGWPMERVYAFGDNNNDLTMLEAAGHGVAMANGNDAAKRAAEFVAAPAVDGGVGLFMRELL